MSTSNQATKDTTAETSLTKDAINLGRYYAWRTINWARPYLGGRRTLIWLAAALLGLGAAFHWNWLVAIGLAPILLTLAPCAAMCAVGLCMNKIGGNSCSSGDQSTKDTTRTGGSAKR